MDQLGSSDLLPVTNGIIEKNHPALSTVEIPWNVRNPTCQWSDRLYQPSLGTWRFGKSPRSQIAWKRNTNITRNPGVSPMICSNHGGLINMKTQPLVLLTTTDLWISYWCWWKIKCMSICSKYVYIYMYVIHDIPSQTWNAFAWNENVNGCHMSWHKAAQQILNQRRLQLKV